MREKILKLAEETLVPIGWYGERAKTIEGLDKFINEIINLIEKNKERGSED